MKVMSFLKVLAFAVLVFSSVSSVSFADVDLNVGVDILAPTTIPMCGYAPSTPTCSVTTLQYIGCNCEETYPPAGSKGDYQCCMNHCATFCPTTPGCVTTCLSGTP